MDSNSFLEERVNHQNSDLNEVTPSKQTSGKSVKQAQPESYYGNSASKSPMKRQRAANEEGPVCEPMIINRPAASKKPDTKTFFKKNSTGK